MQTQTRSKKLAIFNVHAFYINLLHGVIGLFSFKNFTGLSAVFSCFDVCI